MNLLVKWGVKKWLLGIVNTAIAEYNGSVSKARAVVLLYLRKVDALNAFLRSLEAKLADGKLTEDEADELCDEAAAVAAAMVEKPNAATVD